MNKFILIIITNEIIITKLITLIIITNEKKQNEINQLLIHNRYLKINKYH